MPENMPTGISPHEMQIQACENIREEEGKEKKE